MTLALMKTQVIVTLNLRGGGVLLGRMLFKNQRDVCVFGKSNDDLHMCIKTGIKTGQRSVSI